MHVFVVHQHSCMIHPWYDPHSKYRNLYWQSCQWTCQFGQESREPRINWRKNSSNIVILARWAWSYQKGFLNPGDPIHTSKSNNQKEDQAWGSNDSDIIVPATCHCTFRNWHHDTIPSWHHICQQIQKGLGKTNGISCHWNCLHQNQLFVYNFVRRTLPEMVLAMVNMRPMEPPNAGPKALEIM